MWRTLACATLVMTVPASALADVESDAKDLFARGRDLRAHGDCASAIPLFRHAWEIFPHGLGSLRNLAECEQSLGHHASARRAWLDLSRALLIDHDAKYAGWDDEAKRNAAELADKVASLRVDVTVSGRDGEGPANRSSPIAVAINGEAVSLDLLGTPLDRDPGKYRVRVEGPGVEEPVEMSVELAPGREQTVTIIVKLKQAARSEPPPTTAPPTSTRASLAMLWGGVILTGAGVLAGIGSAVAFGVRQGALSDLDSKCSTHTSCNPSLAGVVSRGQTASAVSTALFVGALAAGGVGISLLALSPVVRVQATATGLRVDGTF